MLTKRYYPSLKIKQLQRVIALVVVLVCVLIGAFAVYRFMHPFQSLNPLHHEITVGEKVIDDWTYNGKNEAGELVFYKKEEHHTMPANSHELALDGKYVVIVDATNNTLTFADPIESFPFLWIVVGLGVGGFVLYLLIHKRGRKMKLYPYGRLYLRKNKRAKMYRMFGPRGFIRLRMIRKYFK